MVQMSNKWFIAIITIAIVSSVLIAVGLILGWFAPLAGIGGPFIAGLFEFFAFLPRWVVTGWPQMIAGICLAVAVIFIFGYMFEQKQVIATLKGTNTNTANGPYQDAPQQNTIPVTGLQDSPSNTKKE